MNIFRPDILGLVEQLSYIPTHLLIMALGDAYVK